MPAGKKTAFIPVDVQNDFCPPSGSLAVPEGDQVVTVINELMENNPDWEVFATQDWHPDDHISFAANHPGKQPFIDSIKVHGQEQRLWPKHCVQGSEGAKFHPNLNTSRFKDQVIQKGKNPAVDSYSGFFDNDGKNPTGLDSLLKEKKITDVYVAGLATDYCVRATALDAKKLGYQVYLIQDACRGVDPQASKAAIKEMHDAGVVVIDSSWVPAIESGALSPDLIRASNEMIHYVEQLQQKTKNHNYIKIAFNADQGLLTELKAARDAFFTSGKNPQEFTDTCMKAINSVRQIFSEHRGVGKMREYIYQHIPVRLFKPSKTNSLKKLESFEKEITQQIKNNSSLPNHQPAKATL